MAKCTKTATTDNSPEIWSASPTPFTNEMKVDTASIKKMVEHHIKLGVKGLFLAGTCGEGPWMPDYQKQELFEQTAKYANGKLTLAVQVTDNSAARILENIKMAKNCGADISIYIRKQFKRVRFQSASMIAAKTVTPKCLITLLRKSTPKITLSSLKTAPLICHE